ANVAATSVLPWANAHGGRKEAAPSAPAPLSKRLRSMVLTPALTYRVAKTRHAASETAATCTLSPGHRNGVAGARGSLTLSEAPPRVSTSYTTCGPSGITAFTTPAMRPSPAAASSRNCSGRTDTKTGAPATICGIGLARSTAPPGTRTLATPPSALTNSPESTFAVPTNWLTNSVLGQIGRAHV